MGVLKVKDGSGNWVPIGIGVAQGVWQTYTPTISQNGNIAKTVNYASFCQIDKLVTVVVNMQVTGAGTAGFGIRVSLPVTAKSQNAIVGVGQFYDMSATQRYICACTGISASEFIYAMNGVSTDVIGVSPNLALANGDYLYASITYEAA